MFLNSHRKGLPIIISTTFGFKNWRQFFTCQLFKALKAKDVAIIAELLRDVSDYLGEMTGAIVNEQILDQVFSSFCIGK